MTREMYLSETRASRRVFFYIACDAVGERRLLFCWLVLDEIHINNLAVLPEHRRAGCALGADRHVLKEGRSRGARRATLEVREIE
jgi:ribosomal-protein-alanine N-acetyltransferase